MNLEKLKNYIESPEIFSENMLPPHNPNSSFVSVLNLNGYYGYKYFDSYKDLKFDIEQLVKDSKYLKKIKIPNHVEIASKDSQIQYCNIQYPWDSKEDLSIEGFEVPSIYNPCAYFIKHFEIDKDFVKDRVVLSLEGVESAVALWVNGKYVGYGEDSFTTKEFDVTELIKEGHNSLVLLVIKWTKGSYLEDQDFFRFFGIFRDINLYGYKSSYIYDVVAETDLEENYKIGNVSVNTNIYNYHDNLSIEHKLFETNIKILDGNKYTVTKNQIEVYESKAEKIESKFPESPYISNDGKNIIKIFEVEEPRLWSAEFPNLYTIETVLKNEKNEIISKTETNFGFRKFEIKNGLMCLNGKRIEFYGTDRHEFDCNLGRALTKDIIKQDIFTMKRNNINAVRTSHYPNNTYFYHLCDLFGIYVIDECNMETHGTWELIANPTQNPDLILPKDHMEYEKLLIYRIDNMFFRDRNHASILIWSLGNESYGGKVIYNMSKRLKDLDKTRPIHFESVTDLDTSYPDTIDIYSQMYTPKDKLEKYLQLHTEKPMILCEYTHAMGNSCGAAYKYIQLMETEPRYQGGFVWDFVDQAIRISKENDYKIYYGGDFDDRPNDGNFCGNGLLLSDRKETPKLHSIKHYYSPLYLSINNNELEIKNKWLFRKLENIKLVAYLLIDGIVANEEEIKIDDVNKATFKLPLFDYKTNKEVSIVVKAFDTIYNYEITHCQVLMQNEVVSHDNKNNRVDLVEGRHNISLVSDNYSLMISKLSGKAESLKIGDIELLKEGIRGNFYRPPTDNDRGYNYMGEYHYFKSASIYSTKNTSINNPISINHNNKSIAIEYIMPKPYNYKYRIVYEGYNKYFNIKLEMENKEIEGTIPEFGLIMKLPNIFENVKYFGFGPEESYEDRGEYQINGRYSFKVGDNFTDYLKPQETGAVSRCKEIELTNNYNVGIKITSDENFGFSALNNNPDEIENAKHTWELPNSEYTYLRVYKKQMGVAGDDSWGSKVHPEFRVDLKETNVFEIKIEAI